LIRGGKVLASSDMLAIVLDLGVEVGLFEMGTNLVLCLSYNCCLETKSTIVREDVEIRLYAAVDRHY